MVDGEEGIVGLAELEDPDVRGAVLTVVFGVTTLLARPWVLLMLYQWHVMPLWTEAPPLTYGRIFVLLLVPQAITLKRADGEEGTMRDYAATQMTATVALLVAFGAGWWFS